MIQRRQFLKLGAGSLLGLLATRLHGSRAHAAKAIPAKAKACIVLWMNGGPSHLDTFDPKPGTKNGGPFKAIPSRVPGIQLSEHLPQLAEQAHHLAILRGMTTREGNHQRAAHLMHTGYAPNPTVAYPSLGSWVSHELGDPKFELPSFVSVGGPSAGAGFLGVAHGPFVVIDAAAPPQNTDYPRNVDFTRFLRRKSALSYLEDRFAAETGDTKTAGRKEVYDKAVRMMYAPKLKAFTLDEEPASVRAAYGDSDFGRGCLLARRLVETGVKLIEVTLDGWDTHKDNFTRTTKLMGMLDPAFATLVKELEERKLLDQTVIACLGDFGRTPNINANEGRDHYPKAWSVALAGGGIRGGIVQGATDADGANVVEGAVSVPDLFATVATVMGINPDRTVDTPLGRPISVTQNGTPIQKLIA